MVQFGVYHPWSRENNIQTVFKLFYLLDDIWIVDIWKLLQDEMVFDMFHAVSRFIWIYTVIRPEVINLLEIGWCEFAVPFIRLLILQSLFQLTWLVAYTICQPCNEAIVIQHIIETVKSEFHSFVLVFLQVSFEFLQDTFSNFHRVI